MPRRSLVILNAVLVLVLLAAIPAIAQTVTGTIQGTINDRSGGALPGVTVTIRNAATGLERVVVTNPSGFYNATFLPVGKYNVEAGLSGFGVMRRQGVPVQLNTTTVQDFVLDPAMTETVTVNADAPRINVSDGEIKQTMRSEEIMAIPQSNQNSFLGLASTFAGYQEQPPAFGSGVSADNPALSTGSSVMFNGTGTRGTTFQINGVNNDDSSENQHRQGVSLASIQSFQVLTNNYSAEFGRGYGAVVLVQTKSGTNDLMGELYGYAQDNQYNARGRLDLIKPPATRRQYGITAGFPLIHDKLFGFLNLDYLDNSGSAIDTRPIWTAADLATPRLTLGNDTPANRAWQDAVLARFPNVQPNALFVSPRAYQYAQAFDRPSRDYSGRLDWNPVATNTFTARYQRSNNQSVKSEVIIGEQTDLTQHQSNLGVTWTGIISSNTVQEGRYGLGLRATEWNILAGNDTPIIRFAGVVPSTIIGNASALPINRFQRDNQLVYNLSTARWAKHTLKVGTDIRRSSLNDRAEDRNRGFWNFAASCGGVTYATGFHAFMAGCISSFQKSYGPAYLENELNESNFYAQDDWRPVDNLTLNIGARYENVDAPKEKKNRINYFFGNSSYLDPRLGFAYTPNWDGNAFLHKLTGGNGRFAIRGGFGIYHGRVFQSVFSQVGASVRYNPPNAASINVTSTNLADPAGANGFVFTPGIPPTARVNLTVVDPDLKMPETRQWNLSFERQMFSASRLRMSYIGTLGKGLLQYRFNNLPVKPGAPGTNGTWVVAADWRCAGTGTSSAAPKNATCPNDVPIAANEVSLRFPKINERRPDARYGTNLIVANEAESSYHAGEIEWETGAMRGFSGRATYTFSKALDTGSEATSSGTGDINIFPPDAGSYSRGPSRFDTRHRFTMTGSYLLPFFQNRNDWAGAVFGGWQVSTVVRLASGTPFTIIDNGAADIDFDGVANLRPVVVDPKYSGGYYVNNPNNSVSKMPISAFRHPVYGDTLETLIGRNTYYTDGAETVDFGIYKNFKIPAMGDVIVRLDVFNVFNRVTWGFPVNDINNTNATTGFGHITTTAYIPRVVQLGIRFLY
jgi:hypothetical protein